MNVGGGLRSTDNFQNLIDSSLYYPRHFQKISSKSVHNFCVRLLTDKQTNKQTNAGKNSISLAETITTASTYTHTCSHTHKQIQLYIVREALFFLCLGTNIYNFWGAPEFQGTYHGFMEFLLFLFFLSGFLYCWCERNTEDIL